MFPTNVYLQNTGVEQKYYHHHTFLQTECGLKIPFFCDVTLFYWVSWGPTTWQYITEDWNLQQHCCENLQFCRVHSVKNLPSKIKSASDTVLLSVVTFGKHAVNIFKMFVYLKIMKTDDPLQVQSVYVGIPLKLSVYSRVCTCDSLYTSLST